MEQSEFFKYEKAAWLAGQVIQALEAIASSPNVAVPERRTMLDDVSAVKAIEQRLLARMSERG